MGDWQIIQQFWQEILLRPKFVDIRSTVSDLERFMFLMLA